jgi:translation initiation factor IF-2
MTGARWPRPSDAPSPASWPDRARPHSPGPRGEVLAPRQVDLPPRAPLRCPRDGTDAGREPGPWRGRPFDGSLPPCARRLRRRGGGTGDGDGPWRGARRFPVSGRGARLWQQRDEHAAPARARRRGAGRVHAGWGCFAPEPADAPCARATAGDGGADGGAGGLGRRASAPPGRGGAHAPGNGAPPAHRQRPGEERAGSGRPRGGRGDAGARARAVPRPHRADARRVGRAGPGGGRGGGGDAAPRSARPARVAGRAGGPVVGGVLGRRGPPRARGERGGAWGGRQPDADRLPVGARADGRAGGAGAGGISRGRPGGDPAGPRRSGAPGNGDPPGRGALAAGRDPLLAVVASQASGRRASAARGSCG